MDIVLISCVWDGGDTAWSLRLPAGFFPRAYAYAARIIYQPQMSTETSSERLVGSYL